MDSDGLCELLFGWLARYPIVSIEDPLAEDDAQGMQRFTAAAGRRVQIIGDDYLVTNAARVSSAVEQGACSVPGERWIPFAWIGLSILGIAVQLSMPSKKK